MGETQESAEQRLLEFYTLRAGFRRSFAEAFNRWFAIVVPIVTLVIPLVLAFALPEEQDGEGFWISFGRDWVSTGLMLFILMVLIVFVAVPIVLWLRRRQIRTRPSRK